MTTLEDLLADELDQQGVRAKPDIFREMLTECIGRVTDNGSILLPAGAISLADYVRSIRMNQPQLFETATTQKASGNLTERMRREIAQSLNRSLPSDWEEVRSKHTGLTARMMDEIATARQR